MNFYSLPANGGGYHEELGNNQGFLSVNNNTTRRHITINVLPQEQQLQVGGEMMLRCSVQTDCTNGVSWQWFFNDKPLLDESGQILMRAGITVDMQGLYHCIIYCSCQEQAPVTSTKVFVGIAPPSLVANGQGLVATDKVALLIGNNTYDNNEHLQCACQDVQILSSILQKQMNFKTMAFSNLNLAEMHVALSWFYNIARKGCYCVFYFAGHGYAMNSDLYLLPTDAPQMSQINERSCINVQSLAETLQRRCQPELTVILPDTCRVNTRNGNGMRQTVPTVRGNVVFAYATINRGQAYERVSRRNSVFVEALQQRIHEARRVNDMLTSVGDDIRNILRGGQIVEVCHTLSQHRCLTDRIKPDEVFERKDMWWRMIHESPLPILFVYKGCEVKVSLQVSYLLTNSVLLEAVVVTRGHTMSCSVEFDWRTMMQTQPKISLCEKDGVTALQNDTGEPQNAVCVSGLQKLAENLSVHLILTYVLEDANFIHKKRCQHKIKLPFVREWRQNFARNGPLIH